MRSSFDRRVLSEPLIALVRTCQKRTECHLAGGAALSGAYLAHRLSADVDLACHRPENVRLLLQQLPDVGRECGLRIDVVRDAGTLVRARLGVGGDVAEMDITYESSDDLESPPPPIEGIVVESLADLRAAKLTCLLSRSEPRDLVDVLFLDRAGMPPERDLVLALRKDSGIDAGALAWLLGQFPVSPLPKMLVPLTEAELLRFRDDLRERFRRIAVR